jgi:hypothetical protein
MLPTARLVKFDPGKHPRDHGGQFTMIGRSIAGGTPASAKSTADDTRSLTRGESWQRTGTKIAEIPKEYTGSHRQRSPGQPA